MSDSWAPSRRLQTLSAAISWGELTDEEFAELETILHDPLARRWYRDFSLLQAELRFLVCADKANNAISEFIHAEAESHASAVAIDLSTPSDPIAEASGSPHFPSSLLSAACHGTISFFSRELPFSLLIATVLIGTGLWITSRIYVSTPEQIVRESSPKVQASFDPTLEVVGKITGMVDCKWSEESKSPCGYDNVLIGRQFTLDAGLMEITYETGAKVILHGPVTYEVNSRDGGFLSIGKLTARLKNAEPQAANQKSPLSAIHHPLFTIKTPTAAVTDLGTEFGVEVDKAGTTTSHVFRGTVQVQAVSGDGKMEGEAQVLRANQSARVENRSGNRGKGNHVTLLAPTVPVTVFVRQMPKLTIKTFDLVDVVAGGDGFSGKRNRGIDPTSGQRADSPSKEARLIDDGKYHRVVGLPLVDGVFVPDGRTGRVQIDSAGHAIEVFPTTAYQTSGYIWAGGILPLDDPAQPELHTIPMELGGVDYSSSGHGSIFLHANKGITFDLEAIRRANPGCKLLRFLAVAGNTERATTRGLPTYADFWVFVDGQSRFQRRQIDSSHGASVIAIPLNDKNLFLTLVATDGGNDILGDWIVFGDPRLELVSSDDAAGSALRRTP